MPQDWYNPFVRFLLRSPLHGVMSGSTMLVTYTGRKSGRQYTLPVGYLRQDDTLTTISSRSRIWWRNLRDGSKIELFLKGKHLEAAGEVIEDPGMVAQGLRDYLLQAPQFGRFFNIALDEEGKPNKHDLEREAEQLVLIKMHLPSV